MLKEHEKDWINSLKIEGETYLRAANETAFYDKETGVIETNIHGLNRYRYQNMDDFIRHEITNNFAPHEHSQLIGQRNDETGEIEFNENYEPEYMTVDETEDGSSVYSTFVKVDNPC